MIDILIVGLGIGVVSGLFGIGGGPVLIPLLIYVFHLPLDKVAGTSLAIILPTAFVGVLSHGAKGHVDWRLSLLIAGGGMVGAYLGSQLTDLVPVASLKKAFAVVLLFLALRMLFPGRP